MSYKSLNSGYQKPETVERVKYIQPSNTHRTLGKSKYIEYNEPGLAGKLDLNTVKDPSRISEFPNLSFEADTGYYASPYICSPVRDTTRHYVIGRERKDHPQHFSRYSFGRYFLGHSSQTPGKYDPGSEDCYADPQPNDMAPQQFYANQFIGQCSALGNSSMSQAWNESYWARN